MAGFEVIVRPVVFPSIRPQPARALPPEDDPEQGIATIGGSNGKVIDLTYSLTISKSRSPGNKEQARASDEVQISQKDEDGTVNKENNVRVRVPHHILMRDADGNQYEDIYTRQKEADNIEIKRADVVDYADGD